MLKLSGYSDQDLIIAIRQDDEKAFTELVQRYWKKCHLNALARVDDHETAQEIVQDTFLALWDKRHQYTIDNVSSYLYACIKNKCLNIIESRIIRDKYWDHYKKFLSDREVVKDQPFDYSSLVETIDNGLASLPPKTQLVFKLSRMEGRSIPEIASMLNLSEKAIEYHLSRCLKKLRIHLHDYISSITVAITSFFL